MLRQWSGTVWVELVIESHVAEYMQAGLDLMEMSDLSGQTNSFPAIFTRLLFAMFIKVGAAITGGDRYNPGGTVKDAGKKGFGLGTDGTLKASVIAIDGRTVRESASDERKAIHIVSAWADELGLALR
jgi:hypothetical protein